MSSEWDVGGVQDNDMYRHMWEDIGDGGEEWDFDALNEPDWASWDAPNHTLPANPPSSATFDNSSSPLRLQRYDPPSQTSIIPPNDLYRRDYLQPAENTSSSATTSEDPAQTLSRQLYDAQALIDNQRRQPTAGHSENWLDRTARDTQGPNSFGYIPDNLFETLEENSPASGGTPSTFDGIDIDELLSDTFSDQEAGGMPATRSRRPNGNSVVDLTTDSSPPRGNVGSTRQQMNRKRTAESSSQSSSNKRRRLPIDENVKVEELDLTNEAPSAEEELLQAQQAAAIAAQQAADESKGPLKIGKRQCIICMEPFTNATITHCGHIYCHECLTQALLAGEKNSDRGVGNCPVCRKSVNRKKPNQMVVLSFMKKSAYKGKTKRDLASLG